MINNSNNSNYYQNPNQQQFINQENNYNGSNSNLRRSAVEASNI